MAKKKILVVDDEESLLELVRGILENDGFEVITVESGTECLTKLKSVKPDLILMDMMMPGMSGRETTEKIMSDPRNKNIRIIFLTVANFSESGVKNLRSLGVRDYITKPFENADLIKRVKKAIG